MEAGAGHFLWFGRRKTGQKGGSGKLGLFKDAFGYRATETS